MKEKKVSFKNSKGQKICGILYIPDGKGPFPAFALVHGFGGGTHEEKNIYMCREAAKSGFVAFQFDMYNKPNGCTQTKIEDMSMTHQIDATKHAIDFLENLEFIDKNRIGLTGHSLGGMTVVLYAPKDKRIKALVDQAGVTDRIKLYEGFKKKYGFDVEKWKEVGIHVFKKSWGDMPLKYHYHQDTLKYDVYKTAEKITCPTLVIHGDEDTSVDLAQSKKLMKHLKGKLEVIKGADHCFRTNNTLPIATKLMIDFFKLHLK